jgi:hypothetical protein
MTMISVISQEAADVMTTTTIPSPDLAEAQMALHQLEHTKVKATLRSDLITVTLEMGEVQTVMDMARLRLTQAEMWLLCRLAYLHLYSNYR